MPVAPFRNEITQWGNLGTATYLQYVDYREKFGSNEFVDKLTDILKRSEVNPQKAYFAGLGHNLHMLDKQELESPFRMVP